MRKQLVFATNNKSKLTELRQMVPDGLQLLSLADIRCDVDIPETADTLEGNALIKARYVYEHYHLDCFADDTGLEVDALGGAPGVYTARYATDGHDPEANMKKLLEEMKGIERRTARFRTVIALIKGGEEHIFCGKVEGTIATKKCGTQGFGYDPVFIPEETGQTFAEMGPDKKNLISHRARAVKQLLDYLHKL